MQILLSELCERGRERSFPLYFVHFAPGLQWQEMLLILPYVIPPVIFLPIPHHPHKGRTFDCVVSHALHKESEPGADYLSSIHYDSLQQIALPVIQGIWLSKPEDCGAGSQEGKRKNRLELHKHEQTHRKQDPRKMESDWKPSCWLKSVNLGKG